jgi:hypothetical protein
MRRRIKIARTTGLSATTPKPHGRVHRTCGICTLEVDRVTRVRQDLPYVFPPVSGHEKPSSRTLVDLDRRIRCQNLVGSFPERRFRSNSRCSIHTTPTQAQFRWRCGRAQVSCRSPSCAPGDGDRPPRFPTLHESSAWQMTSIPGNIPAFSDTLA